MIRNFRLGFATNSSSSHSVVLHKDGKRASGTYPRYDFFGWEEFALHSKEDKLDYILSSFHNFSDELLIDFCKKEFGHSNLSKMRKHEGVDHQSEGTVNTPYGVTEELWLDFIMSDDVSIYGGNDNSDGSFPLAYVNGYDVSDNHQYMQDGNALIAFNKKTGVKFRWSKEPYNKSTTPELVDLKITDFCGYGCEFCYQGSTKKGKHANLESIKNIMNEMKDMNVFEIAIGGGEPCHHPYFKEILEYGMELKIICNFTSYGTDWVEKVPTDWCGAVGMSVHNSNDLIKIERAYEKMRSERKYGISIIAQTVIGATPFDVTEKLLDECIERDIPILLLGYKDTGRGLTFNKNMPSDVLIAKLLSRAQNHINNMPSWNNFHLSVDTQFLNQYGNVLDELNISDVLRTSPEGKFSMYIDAVTNTCGPSSYCSKDDMEPINNIREQFKHY